MAITKPSNKKNQNTVIAEEFINAAPDGQPQRKGVKKENANKSVLLFQPIYLIS